MVKIHDDPGENSRKHATEAADLSDDDNDVIDDETFKTKKISQVGKRNRSGVSAEVYGEYNKKESFVAKVNSPLTPGDSQVRRHQNSNPHLARKFHSV